MKLNAENVNAIFKACLFNLKTDDLEDRANIGGVQAQVSFSRARLEQYRIDIKEMVSELPLNFDKEIGGGWTFLNMVTDRDGNQWADLHATADRLLVLGIGTGVMGFLFDDREMWAVMPGGMPYIFTNALS